ncbi:MAG: acyl-CoA dehydrogenase family protein [Gammaproteobacteria bacterium]|nr:acyl-CoA dehydrogenase family protein [Gammaproteobacteria bacterium]
MQATEEIRKTLLDEVAKIAPLLAREATECSEHQHLSAASFEALKDTRLLGCVAPRDLGGDEVDPLTQFEVLEAVSRVDGSTGWCAGILATTSAMVGAFLPTGSAAELFGSRVPPMAGMVAPKGKAVPVSGGYEVSGRWSFGSGIHHSEWVVGGVAVLGSSTLRLVVLPRDDVTIHENWQVAGLQSSGSCDYSVANSFVSDEMTFPLADLMAGQAVTGGAAVRLGIPALVTPFHMSIPIGIAQRALDEVAAQANRKERGFPPSSIAGQADFQMALGEAELEFAAARALAVETLSKLWHAASAGVPSPTLQAETRGVATYVTRVAQRVVTACFQAVGGSALFDTNPLQRCFRDVYATGQHFMVSRTAYQAVGQAKLGVAELNPMT